MSHQIVGSLSWSKTLKSKIEDYIVSLQKEGKIRVTYKDKSWDYSVKIFKRDGMRIFPKRLYRLICDDLKYANIYDTFLDKFYDWEESNE